MFQKKLDCFRHCKYVIYNVTMVIKYDFTCTIIFLFLYRDLDFVNNYSVKDLFNIFILYLILKCQYLLKSYIKR